MIELQGTLKTVKFQAEGENGDVVGTLMVRIHPNEMESGRLSRLAGKDVEITISSRQIPLPLKGSKP